MKTLYLKKPYLEKRLSKELGNGQKKRKTCLKKVSIFLKSLINKNPQLLRIKKNVSLMEKACSIFPFFIRIYCRLYQEVVKKEALLANINKKDVVLHIGCGAIPFTAIIIADLFHAKVIAADKDIKAVHMAKRCVEKIGFSNLIDVIACDCSQWVPDKFDISIIALQAEPKEKIMDTIKDLGLKDIRIILRAASKSFKNHYDPLPTSYLYTAQIKQNMRTFDRSVLYVN